MLYREGSQFQLVPLWGKKFFPKPASALRSLAFWGRAWPHAQHIHCLLVLSPQQAWREAEEDLRATQQVLEEAKERLRDVESGIAMLQAKYKSCIAKKEELEMKCEQCQQRLDRADTVGGRTRFFLLTGDSRISGQGAQC